MQNLAQTLQDQFDTHLTDLGPVISEPDAEGNIVITWSSNNDGHACVIFTLCDIGDPDEKSYDLDISIGNCDNVGPREMMREANLCLEQFYSMGLNTRFGHVVGDFI